MTIKVSLIVFIQFANVNVFTRTYTAKLPAQTYRLLEYISFKRALD